MSAEAGALAGTLLAFGEVLFLVWRHGRPFWHALPYGLLAYGLLGGLFGLIGAGCGRLLRLSGPATAWALTAGVGVAFVGRAHLSNALRRQPQGAVWPVVVDAGSVLGGALCGIGLFLLWRRFLGRRHALGRLGRCTLALLALTAVGLSLHFWGGRSEQPPTGSPTAQAGQGRPNVVLIVVDTLRADALSCFGGSNETPHLDVLAGEGTLYAQAIVQASWTKPSFGTIFTSLYPSSHTAVDEVRPLPRAATTLPELLSENGYLTVGLANNIYLSPGFQFDQGFSEYRYLEPAFYAGANHYAANLAVYVPLEWLHRRWLGDRLSVRYFYHNAQEVSDAAIAWLEANQQNRFFLFLHYMDPHSPYFEHPYDGQGFLMWQDGPLDAAYAPQVRQVYDGEVRYMDREVGRVLEWLRQERLYDQALIVFTADHGEEFQEHGGWDHGLTLYEEQIHVPLIVKYPGGERAGQVITDLARALDIAPTILDVAGLPIPAAMQGRSLYAAGEALPYAFSETERDGNLVRTVRGDRHKWIRANPGNPRGLPSEALFDLQVDPGERSNLVVVSPDIAERLEGILQQVMALARAERLAVEEGALDSGAEEMLQRLGY